MSCCCKPEVSIMATFSHVIQPAVPVCLARCIAYLETAIPCENNIGAVHPVRNCFYSELQVCLC